MQSLAKYSKRQGEKKQKIDRDPAIGMLRILTARVAKIFNTIGISPNAVTISRFFIFVCPAVIFFFIGGYFYNLLGLFLMLTSVFFDLVDGDMARNFNKKTKLGEILDKYFDIISINLILSAITINLFSSENPLRYFSLFAIVGQTLSTEVSKFYEDKFGITCGKILSSDIELMVNKNRVDLASNILIELLSPSHIFSLLFSTMKYYLIAGILFGILPITITLYSIAINFRWITLFIVLWRYYSIATDKKKYLFKTLEVIENNKK